MLYLLNRHQCVHRHTGKGAGGTAGPPVLEIFGQNTYDLGKSTWDKLFIESSSYNMTKWSILKTFNGSAANLLIAGNNNNYC